MLTLQMMGNAWYHLVLICVAVAGIWRGYRKGLVHQLAGVLGIGFGIVASRLFSGMLAEWLIERYPGIGISWCPDFVYGALASAIVFGVAFMACRLAAGVLRSAMQFIHVGALNSLLGAVFGLLKYLLIVSIVFNLILCFDKDSELLSMHDDNDGNMVELVLDLAPALLGTPSPGDLEHESQLREAKKISFNYSGTTDVDSMDNYIQII